MLSHRFSKTSLQRRHGVDARMIEVSDLALQLSPVDFGIAKDGGLRTAERQHELYLAGASRCDGYILKSKHQSGEALDFYAFVDGQASWQVPHLAIVGAAFLQASIVTGHKLRWGGFFTPLHDEPFPHGWDCGHIELI